MGRLGEHFLVIFQRDKMIQFSVKNIPTFLTHLFSPIILKMSSLPALLILS